MTSHLSIPGLHRISRAREARAVHQVLLSCLLHSRLASRAASSQHDVTQASILRKSCEMTSTSFFYPTAVECMFNEPFYFSKSNFESWTTVLNNRAEKGDATKQKQLAYYALGSLKRLRDESVHPCTFVLCSACFVCFKQCQFGID